MLPDADPMSARREHQDLAERRARALEQAAEEGLELPRSSRAQSGFRNVYFIATPPGYYAQNACIPTAGNRTGYLHSPVAEEIALALARRNRRRTPPAHAQPA
eukprot:scaffold33012_cov90-Isochrysis_galbana.AAC.1